MRFLTFISAILFSALAFAANPKSVQKYTLSKVFINGEQAHGVVGLLQIDERVKLIKAEIYDDPCGKYLADVPGRAKCLAMPELRHIIVVPYRNRIISCGSQVYKAVAGLSLASGARHELSVVDHSTRICRDLVPSRVIMVFKAYHDETGEAIEYTLMK